MNSKEASEKLEAGKALLMETRDFMKAPENPEATSAVVMFGAVGRPDGHTQFIGTMIGNGRNIIDTLVEAMENDPNAAELITEAVSLFLHHQTCDCENCVERRRTAALNNMLNNSKN